MPLTGPDLPRVSFMVIVLDGEPFTRYTLRSLYPFAHQIIVAEGASPGARRIAGPDGHSRDGTLDVLRRFVREEDTDGKVTLLTAEDEGHPDGFWPGEKDEQGQACARRATGDYLWQVDIDEMYQAEHMRRVLDLLGREPSISGMSFRQLTFWGALDYVVDGWYLRRGASLYRRLFRWGEGYTYARHRPPTVLDPEGRDLCSLGWRDGREIEKLGVRLYHYSLLLPKQVVEKCEYYREADWAAREGALDWAADAFLRLGRPFRVHNVYTHPSWLERYRGEHPEGARRLMADLATANGPIRLRDTADIERLLGSRGYRLGRWLLRVLDPVEDHGRRAARRLARPFRRMRGRVP